MKINESTEDYHDCVEALSKDVAETVIETLEAYSVPKEILDKIKGELAFNVCTLIDGGKDIKINSKSFTPNMTFLSEDSEELLYSVNGSFTHEYVYDFTDDE